MTDDSSLPEGQRALLYYCHLAGLPEPECEYQFDDTRKWRFDCCWVKEKTACEVDGGVWARGRHVRGAGYERDCEKLNTAAAMGWAVLRFTPQMLERDPDRCMAWIRIALGRGTREEIQALHLVRHAE